MLLSKNQFARSRCSKSRRAFIDSIPPGGSSPSAVFSLFRRLAPFAFSTTHTRTRHKEMIPLAQGLTLALVIPLTARGQPYLLTGAAARSGRRRRRRFRCSRLRGVNEASTPRIRPWRERLVPGHTRRQRLVSGRGVNASYLTEASTRRPRPYEASMPRIRPWRQRFVFGPLPRPSTSPA
jgi:hypothetical protein